MWYYRTNKRRFVAVPLKMSSLLKFLILVLVLSIVSAAGANARGRIDEDLAKEYFEIAQAYSEVSKYDKAVLFYLKAAKNPAHRNAAEYNLARVYGLQGDWKSARPILERQYNEAPGNVLILKAFAYSLAASGDEVRACEMYKNLYDNDTENPEAALNYARILIFAKKYAEAGSLIEELKPRFTENAEKKTLDELEEKLRKALEPPEEKTADKPKDDGKPAQQTTDKPKDEGKPEEPPPAAKKPLEHL